MAIKIDLLPIESKIKGSYIKAAKFAKTLGLILISIYLLGSIFVTGYILVLNSQIGSIENNIEKLKIDIRSLESSEQKIVLLKDRISKIKYIMTLKSANTGLDSIKDIIDKLDENSSVTELKIDTSRIEASFNLKSTSALYSFMNNLQSQQFTNLKIDNFTFNPNTGYLISVVINNK